MEELEKLYEDGWNEWQKFPNPHKGEYLNAPIGCGVYQLRNSKNGALVLFGRSKHLAYRMSSLLPSPEGVGIRKNVAKRRYVLDNIEDIEYRTISFLDKDKVKEFEKYIKTLKIHLFNS